MDIIAEIFARFVAFIADAVHGLLSIFGYRIAAAGSGLVIIHLYGYPLLWTGIFVIFVLILYNAPVRRLAARLRKRSSD